MTRQSIDAESLRPLREAQPSDDDLASAPGCSNGSGARRARSFASAAFGTPRAQAHQRSSASDSARCTSRWRGCSSPQRRAPRSVTMCSNAPRRRHPWSANPVIVKKRAPAVRPRPTTARPVEAAAPAPVAALPALPRSKVESSPAPSKAVQSEAENELLVEAMRARRDGNPKRVARLVDEYRAKHPQGTLQEEALILSIESAASRRAPNTAALAREYLTRFPRGRFAEQARRALSLEAR